MIAETRPIESRGSKQAVAAWVMYVSIAHPPNLSPTESQDVWREGHSIDASHQICRASVSCRKGPPHDRESGRRADRAIRGACESERAEHRRPGATWSELQREQSLLFWIYLDLFDEEPMGNA